MAQPTDTAVVFVKSIFTALFCAWRSHLHRGLYNCLGCYKVLKLSAARTSSIQQPDIAASLFALDQTVALGREGTVLHNLQSCSAYLSSFSLFLVSRDKDLLWKWEALKKQRRRTFCSMLQGGETMLWNASLWQTGICDPAPAPCWEPVSLKGNVWLLSPLASCYLSYFKDLSGGSWARAWSSFLGFCFFCGFAAPPAYGQKMEPSIAAVTFGRLNMLARCIFQWK